MSALPFAPLTLGELNARCDAMQGRIAWVVATRVEDGRPIDDERLRALAVELNTLHDAAHLRVERTGLR